MSIPHGAGAVDGFLIRTLRDGGIPWQGLVDESFRDRYLERAIHHGVDALIAYRSARRGADRLRPASLRESLKQRLRVAATLEAVRAHDLRVLSGTMAAAGFSPLVIEGGALAYTHYPDPATRSRQDTDLCIAPREVARVRALLEDLGYEVAGPIYKSHQFGATRSSYGRRAVRYDVHWRPNNDPVCARVLGFEDLARDAADVPGLRDIRSPCDAHSLLLAIMHRATNRHGDRDRLIWLYDIHLLLKTMSREQLRVFERLAESSGIQDMCAEGIDIARDTFGTRAAAPVVKSPARPRRIFAGVRSLRETHLALVLDDFRRLPGVASRAQLLRELFLPSPAYLLVKFDKSGRWWLPVLYCRYLFGGLYARLTLR